MSGDTPPERTAIQTWIRTNQGIGVILTSWLGLYLLYLQFSTWVHEELRDGFTLGFFPVTGVIMMIVCTVTLILDGNRREQIQELAEMKWKWFFFCFWVLVACGIYFYLILGVGFLLVSPVFLSFFIYMLRMRPWTSCAAAGVVMTVLVYGLFRVIGIELPPGIVPF